jgi:hypothetical protein
MIGVAFQYRFNVITFWFLMFSVEKDLVMRPYSTLRTAPKWATLAVVCLLVGCDKIPTWSELTNQQPPAQQPQQPNAIVSPTVPAKMEPPAAPMQTPRERAEEVIAKFKQLRPAEVDDAAIASLTSLEEGAELVTEINAANSGKVTDEGLANLHRLTSLKVLELTGTRVGDKGCEQIGKVPSLEDSTSTARSCPKKGSPSSADFRPWRRYGSIIPAWTTRR